jgi:hypothetical protein
MSLGPLHGHMLLYALAASIDQNLQADASESRGLDMY